MKLPQVILKQQKTSNIFSKAFNKVLSIFKKEPDIIDLGGGVIIDIKNKKLIVPDEFKIVSTGTLRIYTDKHLILSSSTLPTGNENDVYSIWLNPDFDENGEPLSKKVSTEEVVYVPLENNEPQILMEDKTGDNKV